MSNIVLITIGIIGYIIYYFITATYIKNIISFRSRSVVIHIRALIIIVAYIIIMVLSRVEDVFVMFGYSILMYILYKTMYKEITLKIVYIILFSTLSIYACILVYRGFIAIAYDLTFTYVSKNIGIDLIAAILSIYTNVLAMIILRKVVDEGEIRVFFADKEGVLFTTTIFFYAYMYSGYNTVNTYLEEPYPFIKVIQIKIGLFLFLGTFLFSFFGYLLSRFNLFRDKTRQVQVQLHNLREEEKKYLDIATYCPMTGAYKRAYGIVYLKNKLAQNEKVFTVTFIDLDGLKKVNDQLGHQAGDLYICSVVNVLKNTCEGSMISRYGGDEFLVIMDEKDQYEAEKSLILSCKTVEEIAKSSDINFEMSISYGYYEVTPKNKLSYEEILDMIDNRMYEFKKARKKTRQS